MSAVVVQNVYKKFGKPADPFWKRMFSRANKENGSNGLNGNGNGHKTEHDRVNGNGHNPKGMEAAPLTKADAAAGQKNGSGSKPANNNGNGKPAVIAVNHVSFTIEQGEIFGVLGPNGGGKSTLIRLISTLLLPDSGKIYVFGHDVEKQPMQVQRMINRVSVEASFFKKPALV